MKETLSIPHNIETEQALLGAIIEDPEELPKVSTFLKPSSFYKPAHQHIYKTIVELSGQGHPVDEITVGDQLRRINKLDEAGGYAYIAELVNCVPASTNVLYYGRTIEEDATMRELISITIDIGKKARDPEQNVTELLLEAQRNILQLSTYNPTRKTTHIKETLSELVKTWEENQDKIDVVPGLPTGFHGLDKFTGGLIAPALWVIAARPKMGKTAFAVNIVEYVTSLEYVKGAVLFFSLEMSKRQIGNRTITSNALVDNKKVKFGNLDNEDWDRLMRSVNKLSAKNVYLNSGSRNITEIAAEARLSNLEQKDGIALIVVDYLQLIKGSRPNMPREQEVSEVTRELKLLAVEMDCPVIALSQLNRDLEKRTNKRPQLSDLRESGAIEQDADIIIFIYRDEVYNPMTREKGVAEIIIGGHREGPTGTIELGFKGEYTKFFNKY